MTGRFGAAVSEHPLLTHATGEVVGDVLEAVGEAPDIAILFATAPTTGALDDVCEAVRATLGPTMFLACTAVSVAANRREVEDVQAVALWAGRIAGLRPVRLEAEPVDDGWTVTGFPADVHTGTLVLLADPFSFPVDALLTQLRATAPDVVVSGGLASASAVPGGNRLDLDDHHWSSGAVGVIVPEGIARPLVSQGCRPVGDPFTVTAVNGNLVTELGGRRALDRLREVVDAADAATRTLMQQGLHIGIVVNEQQADFDRGDFLIRGVMGADESTGAVAIGDRVEVGQTVQFQVRDAETADEDLRHLLAGHRAAGALLFTCNGRGSRLFSEPDHDAAVIHEALGAPLAGMFCAGEIGPIGGRNHMHGFTASVVLFE